MIGKVHARARYGARCQSRAAPAGARRRRKSLDLKPLYGWAAQPLARLCALEPGLAGFIIGAPAHTRHYVAMAIAGMRTQGLVTETWLANALASASRREVLHRVWDRDPGSTRALMRLGPEVLSEGGYAALANVLGDDLRRRAYGDLKAPSERAVLRIAEAGDDVVAAYRGRLIAAFGSAGILFLLQGIARLRPDLLAASIKRSLNSLEKPSRIEHLFTRLCRNLTLPEPPWSGTSTIRPLRSVPELRAAGTRLENCLGTLAIWNEALSGRRAFYLVEGRELCVVALARHEVFGTWFVYSMAKRRNGEPSTEVKARIVAAFASAGFPYFDGAPIGTGLTGDL